MHVFTTLLILATFGAAPTPVAETAPRLPEAVELLNCAFEADDDANFDAWPDHWTRRRGEGFPAYVEMAIRGATAEAPAASGEHFFEIRLNGGGAMARSRPIPASPMFSYVLEGKLRTEKLAKSVAFYSISFYDAKGELVETHRSQPVHDVHDWKKITLGPIVTGDERVREAVIGLHLEPTEGAGDLHGVAAFDDVWFARLPKMHLTSNSEYNVFSQPGDVEITCKVSGILERDPPLLFELIDVSGNRLAEMEKKLAGRLVQQQSPLAAMAPRATKPGDKAEVLGYAGAAAWKPPIKDYGFYRVRVTMRGGAGVLHERNLTLAVLRPEPRATTGEFGWSITRAEDPLPMKALVGLLPQVGIHWVKYPAWHGDKESREIDRLAWFAEKLSLQNIEMVGVLDQPPADMRKLFGEAGRLPVASMFVEPQLWHPAIDPVMTRLSLKVRWWQLGADDDMSYVGYPEMEAKLHEIKEHLDKFGQVINLGLSWRWLNQTPTSATPPWAFLSYGVDPPFTAEELSAYLALDTKPPARRWVVLQPLERGQYTVEERARDLVERMLAAKMGRADAAFVPDPFNTRFGLMNDDGTPGELLLPWRTTAVMLSGAQYVGSMALPNGSRNYVFARGNEAVLVMWNERPTTETLNLGENVKQVDLFGRVITPEGREHEQTISVGPLPTFITGANLALARWRMSFQFPERQLQPVFGRWNSVNFKFRNSFEQGVGGTVRINAPEGWELEQPELRFRAAPGQEIEDAFRVRLKDAASGVQSIKLDFDVTADRVYKFSVYDKMEIGLGEVHVEVATRLNDRGDLVVEQTTINETDKPVSFNCYLYAPDRRRLRQLVLDLNRGRTVNSYIVPKGEELAGKKLLLRAEEINGDRILNIRVPVEL